MHSPLPVDEVPAVDDLEIGPQLPRRRLNAADDDVGRRPVLALGDRDVQQLLGGQRMALVVAGDSRQDQELVGLGRLESAGRLVRRALAHHDQVERVARDRQAVLQALDQAEQDARRPDDQAGAQHGHQRRLPADPQVADVVLERDHGGLR